MPSETLTQILITNPDKNPDEIPEVFVVSGSTLVASDSGRNGRALFGRVYV